MVKDKVSIIVLTYMDFSKIEKTLISCINQDYNCMEIIVRDDGTPNFSREKIEEIFLKYNCQKKYLVVHDECNRGTVTNFNEAIKISSGEFIIVVSGDDYLKKLNTVSKIVKKFKENEECMCVVAREEHILPDGRMVILPSFYEELAIKYFSKKKLWYLISAYPCFILGSATSYRREVFNKVGMFDNNYRLLEDWPLYLKIFENNMCISFLSDVTIYHASGGVSTPQQGGRNKLLVKDDIKCITYVIDHAEIMNLSKRQKKTLIYRRELLKSELWEKEDADIRRKYFGLSIFQYMIKKIKNLSLRLDIRKIRL